MLNKIVIPDGLKSRRFWSALIWLAVMFLRAFNADVADAIPVEQLTLIIGLLIGGYTLEDYADAINPTPNSPTE